MSFAGQYLYFNSEGGITKICPWTLPKKDKGNERSKLFTVTVQHVKPKDKIRKQLARGLWVKKTNPIAEFEGGGT
jgi:hypothetical protein